MAANEFVNKLKASGSPNDFTDLASGLVDYKRIVARLPTEDRISFSLNVLCILCRNLDKVASWRDSVSIKELLGLSIECVRETRPAERPERVKALACVCHIHKIVIRQSTAAPPELVLKLSYMPFELDPECLLAEHSKTYWNILDDRITYLEGLRAARRPVVKLLLKLVEDYEKVLKVSDSVKFCQLVLVFLVKKLYHLFGDGHTSELNDTYKGIFDVLASKSDLKNFKELTDKETMDIYVKFSQCIYVVMGNSSKGKFKKSFLPELVKVCIAAVGHKTDLYHCLQAFYLNTFCNLLTENPNSALTSIYLGGIVVSCEMTETRSFKDAMMATYPYIYQLLRLYMEYTVDNVDANWAESFTAETQESCLKAVLFLMAKLKDTDQMLKCDKCTARTGLHDAVRLSFPVKSIISASVSQEMDLSAVLPIYYAIVEKQQELLNGLDALSCRNHQKYVQKAQTDTHNTAILLHKAKSYGFSVKVFDLYLRQEIGGHKGPSDKKNISRGFYNKAICELDSKLFEDSLKSAYLSLLFAQPEDIDAKKHMSLVIDIKSKEIKSRDPNNSEDMCEDRLQLLTVKQVYEMCLVTVLYGDLREYIGDLKISQLLWHEFKAYASMWPSITPMAGVWIALHDMVENGLGDLPAEDPSVVLGVLHDVVLETPNVVRTIHNDHLRTITLSLLAKFEEMEGVDTQKTPTSDIFGNSVQTCQPPTTGHDNEEKAPRELVKTNERTAEDVLMHATLLFLKTEYDLAEASAKFGWKTSEVSMDPDLASSARTIPQEHQALQAAARSVEIVSSGLVQLLQLARSRRVTLSLRIWRVGVPLLLSMGWRAHALQLAQAVCRLADVQEDSESYTQAAGALLARAAGPYPRLESILRRGCQLAERTAVDGEGLEAALVFLCEAAMYRAACGAPGCAAKLLQHAQAQMLASPPAVNLELAVGRVLDVQTVICGRAGSCAAVWAQRHYLALPNPETRWSSRRLRSLYTRLHSAEAGLRTCVRCRALLLWRRARSACAAALQHSAACDAARLLATCTCVHNADEAQVKIDNRLKYILGLQPTSDTPSQQPLAEQKRNVPLYDPLETMLDAQTFRRAQLSPSLPCTTVPAFHMPDFMSHGEACACYACQTPFCFVLACQTAGLEASVYYRAKEHDIARHYFDGVFKMFGFAEQKLKHAVKGYKKLGFEGYVVEIVSRYYRRGFLKVQVEIFIEASFFELSQANYPRADGYIVRIHELMQEAPDLELYLQNEVMNLMSASAYLRKIIKPADSDETGLETELENLKLSPMNIKQSLEIQKTPESKADRPPKVTRSKVVLTDEEIPNLKRKVIKLNLDDTEESTSTKPASRKTRFKTPVPITRKPVPETITPAPKAKAVPKIVVTHPSLILPSLEATPQKKSQEKSLATPSGSTINEDVFFTPQTSVKTYAKKSLRKDLVKNLDKEFATPEAEGKENVAGGSRSHRARKKVESGSLRSLQRSTSPGNLDDNQLLKKKEPTRPKLKNQKVGAEESRKK